jgi:hypothetical protein
VAPDASVVHPGQLLVPLRASEVIDVTCHTRVDIAKNGVQWQAVHVAGCLEDIPTAVVTTNGQLTPQEAVKLAFAAARVVFWSIFSSW